MYLREIGLGDWILHQWWDFVETVMNIRVPQNSGETLVELSDSRGLKEDSAS
jgi:hypothetical protein